MGELMTISVHILARNEEAMLPYALRHYQTYAQEITVHDLGSQDKTMDIARSFGAAVKQHDSGGEFRDMLNKQIRNSCWVGTDADWVVIVDCDELIYFGAGAKETLTCYDQQNIAFPKPIGYEMTSDVFPTGSGQIYDEVKHGSVETAWYSKPGIFSPKRVASTDFGTGAHMVSAVLKDGKKIVVDRGTPFASPACKLLHFHHLGPVEKIGAKYEAVIARLSPENRAHKWGVQALPFQHAKDKRAAILSKLERVMP